MRISELVETVTTELTDWFVVDSPTGTRKFSFSNLLNGIKSKLNYLDFLEGDIPVEQRINTWRGKNLGSTVTQAQWDAIGDGSYKGLFLGDYWEIDNRIWRIMDFNYWRNGGDSTNVCRTNHLVIMPDRPLYQHVMNDADTTTGGYVGSKMYTSGLNEAKTIINNAFGSSHILNHREILINAVTDGRPSGVVWVDSTVEIPSETMIYGMYIYTAANNGLLNVNRSNIDINQLQGIQRRQVYRNPHRNNYWLRDVSSSNSFVISDTSNGTSHRSSSTTNINVRPVFGICKENTTS